MMRPQGCPPSATRRERRWRAPLWCCVTAAIACTSHPTDESVGRDTAGSPDAGTISLFNGIDFSGWDRYLGKPSEAEPALGIDNDPRGVYSVVMLDGEPAIRISGEIWGALISRQELGEFHLRAEYKWGASTWPPSSLFDSGIMYLSNGPLGAVNAGGPALSDPIGSGAFMVSMEYQVLPRDVGGCYNLGPIRFQAAPRAPGRERAGGWNQIDIVFQSGGAQHFLNGELVAGGSEIRLEWPGMPVTSLQRGKLQIQSEGAEIYYRRVELLPLR
jgi:hypothetical protein